MIFSAWKESNYWSLAFFVVLIIISICCDICRNCNKETADSNPAPVAVLAQQNSAETLLLTNSRPATVTHFEIADHPIGGHLAPVVVVQPPSRLESNTTIYSNREWRPRDADVQVPLLLQTPTPTAPTAPPSVVTIESLPYPTVDPIGMPQPHIGFPSLPTNTNLNFSDVSLRPIAPPPPISPSDDPPSYEEVMRKA